MRTKRIISLLLRLTVAIILLQTLYFKFSGSPESVELFSKLGVEPWGRIVTGVLELLTVILILITSTRFFGALLGSMIMLGAIFTHVLVIGIESGDDGGLLFILAIIVFICCLLLMTIHKQQGLLFLKKFVDKRF